MEWDYVYGNFQLTVTLKADNDSPFGRLTDREVLSLQQLFYLTLTNFSYVRGLYAADIAALQARLDAEKDMFDSEQTGG